MSMEESEDDPPVVMLEEEQEVVHVNVSLDVPNTSAAASTSPHSARSTHAHAGHACLLLVMGDYYTPARETMEIMRPEGHIMPPEGCIMLPEGCRRQEGGIMIPEGLHSFHWPKGRVQ